MARVIRVLAPLGIVWLSMSPLMALAGDTLAVNQSLSINQNLTSSDGRFKFWLQGDGNLVLRNASGAAVWASGTNGMKGQKLNMQGDGNLVLRTSSGAAVWSSKTNGTNAIKVVMQTNGDLVMRTSAGAVVWSTGTGATPPADTVKPVISLNGASSMTLTQETTFTDPGATANDDRDGNISSRITVTGSVNTAVAGTYTLSYNVKDAAGNAASTVIRTVTVNASIPTTKVTLPIEVLGVAGTTKTVTLNLADVSRITHLYLRCNACGYDDIALNKNASQIKATVSINGGTPIALKQFKEGSTVYGNAQIQVIGGEASYRSKCTRLLLRFL